MKIVFLNVWGDRMTDALRPYLEAQALDTDIFCLQEMTPYVRERCGSIFSGFSEIADNKYISEHDHFPLSIFTKDTIKAVSHGTLMKEPMDRGLAMYIEVDIDGKRLFVCNVHGKSRPGNKLDDEGRLAQSKDLISFFESITDPVIVGGDFNILPDTRSIRMFGENGYGDLIQEYGIDTTRNRLAWDRFPAKLLYSDYTFTKGDVRLEGFEVPKNEVSDHLPMILHVEV